MRFISTNKNSASVGLREAVDTCLASDGGLYLPDHLNAIPAAFFNNIGEMGLRDIAYIVASSFLGEDIEAAALKNIVDYAFAYDTPLKDLGNNIFALELFHGPTLTFKDYGARFMAKLLNTIDGNKTYKRNIIVATTGNTGAAAANGLFKLEGVSVTVLYPKGKLSRVQTAQFAALGENIHPVEIMGTVDDCKMLMQKAMADPSLADFRLTGANSINIARLIPQVSFALYAFARLKALEIPEADKAIYTIPAGNLSNVIATVLAHKLGMPMGKILAVTTPTNRLKSIVCPGDKPESTTAISLTPSTDMTYPSGWPRLNALYNGDLDALRQDIDVINNIDDKDIIDTINSLRSTCGYTLDPHGALAYAAASGLSASTPKIVFATGHPAKQLDIMTRITGAAIEMPVQFNRFMALKRHPVILPPTLPALKKHLTSIN